MEQRVHKNRKSFKNTIVFWFRKHVGEKAYLKSIARIALPVYLTSMLALIVNIVDSIMIAPLGSDKIAAVNAASEINFFSYAVISGFLVMGFIYFSQYHGKNKTGYEAKASLTTSLYWTIGISVFMVVIVQFFATDLVNLFLHSKGTQSMSAEYLKIISFSWIPMAIMTTIVRGLIRCGKPKASILVSITSLILNIVLNYMFINGVGVPKLGLKGVAIATLVSRVAELGVAVSILLILRIPEFFQFGHPKFISSKITKKILSKSLVWFNELFWSLSLIVQFGLISTRGDAATAIIGSAHVVAQILFAAHGGFSGVVGYFVGRQLGKGELEKAKQKAIQIHKTIMFFAFMYSLVFFAISYGVVQLYATDGAVGITPKQFEMFLLYAVWTLAAMYTFFTLELVYVNLLWLGGRVVQAFIGDVVTNWFINLIMFLLVRFTTISFLELFMFVTFGDILKTSTLYYFYRRYDWLVDLTGNEERHPIIKKIISVFRKKEKIGEKE